MGFRWTNIRLFIVAFLVVMVSFVSTTRMARRCASALFSPVFSVFSYVAQLFVNGARVVIPGTMGKEAKIHQLQAENLKLKMQLGQMSHIEQVNRQLRAAANLPLSPQWHVIPGEVIARPPEKWYESMTVNRGSADGVRQGAAVLCENGNIFGRVIECNRHNCRIATILSPECSMGVMLLGQSPDASGVMQGIGSLEFLKAGNGFTVDYLPRTLIAQKGDTIVTSGLGLTMPYGLVVGYVAEPIFIEGALRGKLYARPAASFGVVHMVYIVCK